MWWMMQGRPQGPAATTMRKQDRQKNKFVLMNSISKKKSQSHNKKKLQKKK